MFLKLKVHLSKNPSKGAKGLLFRRRESLSQLQLGPYWTVREQFARCSNLLANISRVTRLFLSSNDFLRFSSLDFHVFSKNGCTRVTPYSLSFWRSITLITNHANSPFDLVSLFCAAPCWGVLNVTAKEQAQAPQANFFFKRLWSFGVHCWVTFSQFGGRP